MAQTPEYQKLTTDIPLMFGNDDVLMTKIENVMRLSLIPVSAEMVGALVEEFFELAYLGALVTFQVGAKILG